MPSHSELLRVRNFNIQVLGRQRWGHKKLRKYEAQKLSLSPLHREDCHSMPLIVLISCSLGCKNPEMDRGEREEVVIFCPPGPRQ